MKKLFATVILSVVLLLPQRLFAQNTYDSLDRALRWGDLATAKSIMTNLDSGPRLDAYQSVYAVLFSRQAFDEAIKK